ncbi:MAG TPA: hypothetical protein PKM73_16405 [Verrucomicrobiota bacterium]|nr:hypothetical protein [Verrucomicrobiota bacterium]HNU51121.1 hypothetical protein [Verrucomicrobiota bacterium]
MQRAKTLTRLLKHLVEVVAEEADQNPAFAAKLDGILAEVSSASGKRPKGAKGAPADEVPDVYAEYQQKGEEEFRFWLRGLSVAVLKGIVKANGFDPGKVSRPWTEPDKFVGLITEQLKARLSRGAAFMTRKSVGGGAAGAAEGNEERP